MSRVRDPFDFVDWRLCDRPWLRVRCLMSIAGRVACSPLYSWLGDLSEDEAAIYVGLATVRCTKCRLLSWAAASARATIVYDGRLPVPQLGPKAMQASRWSPGPLFAFSNEIVTSHRVISSLGVTYPHPLYEGRLPEAS